MGIYSLVNYELIVQTLLQLSVIHVFPPTKVGVTRSAMPTALEAWV